MNKKPTYEELEQKIIELEQKISKKPTLSEFHAAKNSNLIFKEIFNYINENIIIFKYIAKTNEFIITEVNLSLFNINLPNPQLVREGILNLTLREFLSKNTNLNETEIQNNYSLFEQTIHKFQKSYHQTSFATQDNSIIDSNYHLIPFRDETDQSLYVIYLATNTTEKDKITQALQESENRYKLLVENINVGIFISTLDGNFTYANKELALYGGCSSVDEFLKIPVQNLYFNPADRDIILAELQKNGAIKNKEIQCRKKDGTTSWITINAIILGESGQNPNAILGFAKDISDKKNAENSLIFNEHRQALMMKNLLDIIVIVSAEGIQKYISPSVQYITGYTPEELNVPITEICHPDDIPSIQETWEQCLKNPNQPVTLRYRHKYKYGGYVHLEAKAQNYLNDPFLKGVLANTRDITAHINTEQSILRSKNLLDEMGRLAKIGGWEFETETLSLVWTDEIYRIHQLPNTYHPTLDTALDFYTTESRPVFEKAIFSLIKDGTPFDLELTINNNNKQTIHVRTLGMAVWENGKIKKVFGVFQDISERKIIDEELKNQYQEYHSLYEEHLALNKELILTIDELKKSNEQLISAKEKAEENDRLKSAFLANISHEISTPMNGIIGFSQMLANEENNSEKRRFFSDIIETSSKQLLSIVNDILDISKIETGQVEVKLVPTNINNLILELLSYFKPMTMKSNVGLYVKKELSSQFSEINTDKNKLKQILTHLISNALKFTNKGYVEFGYTLKDSDIEFFVKDTGIGIAEEQHQNIFERFRQAEISSKRAFGGTGLGLSICKGFLEHMGGNIWLQSQTNIGTTFYFTIPFQPIAVHKKTLSGSNEQGLSEKKAILVAEDEAINYFFIEEILIDMNYNVYHARTGTEAVDIFTKNSDIALVFMDVKMPELDGIEATMLIKKIRPEIPIIAQTAYALMEDEEKMKSQGFDDYISKPMNQQDVIDKVKKYLGN